MRSGRNSPKGSLSIRRRGATRLRMLRTREMRSPGPAESGNTKRKAGTRSGRCGGQAEVSRDRCGEMRSGLLRGGHCGSFRRSFLWLRSLASASDTMNGIHSGGQGSWHTYKKTCGPRNLTSPLQDAKVSPPRLRLFKLAEISTRHHKRSDRR